MVLILNREDGVIFLGTDFIEYVDVFINCNTEVW